MYNKKEKILIGLTVAVLAVIVTFSIFNWDVMVYLFSQMGSGAEIVKEYVLSLGAVGPFAITAVIVACFFFPVISSIPMQLASVVSYGLPFAILHVIISIFLASQLAFLFTRTTRVFMTKKKIAKQKELEEKIKNSNRNIIYFLVLAYLAPFVPFLLIHMVAANSGLKWWKYSLVTLIGPIPDIVITLWAGVKITSSSTPITSYIVLVIIIACVIFSLIYKNRIIDMIFTPRKEKDYADKQ